MKVDHDLRRLPAATNRAVVTALTDIFNRAQMSVHSIIEPNYRRQIRLKRRLEHQIGDKCSDRLTGMIAANPPATEIPPDSRHPITHVASAFFFRLPFCITQRLAWRLFVYLARCDGCGVSALLGGVVGVGAGVFVVGGEVGDLWCERFTAISFASASALSA